MYPIYTAHPLALLAFGFAFGVCAGYLVAAMQQRSAARPKCTPGNCFCRTTCACMLMERAR